MQRYVLKTDILCHPCSRQKNDRCFLVAFKICFILYLLKLSVCRVFNVIFMSILTPPHTHTLNTDISSSLNTWYSAEGQRILWLFHYHIQPKFGWFLDATCNWPHSEKTMKHLVIDRGEKMYRTKGLLYFFQELFHVSIAEQNDHSLSCYINMVKAARDNHN